MNAVYKAQDDHPVKESEAGSERRAEEAVAKATPEERLRTLCGIAFLQLSREDMGFAQRAAMLVTSHMETLAGQPEQPMPVMLTDGRWACPLLEEDPMLVTRLTVEALVFSLLPFLAESGPGRSSQAA